MNAEVILIVIGAGLIFGAFYSAWLLWKVVDGIEKEKKRNTK